MKLLRFLSVIVRLIQWKQQVWVEFDRDHQPEDSPILRTSLDLIIKL